MRNTQLPSGEAVLARGDRSTPRRMLGMRRLATDYVTCTCCAGVARFRLKRRWRRSMKLLRAGKIRYWGVSNVDTPDMEELVRRGIEFDRMPWCKQRKLPIMAYSRSSRAACSAILSCCALRENIPPRPHRSPCAGCCATI